MSCSGSERTKAEKKGTQGTGRRQALVEQLWERNEEGRKETNRKLSTGTGKESMETCWRERGKRKKRKQKTSTEEATVRRKQEEKGKEETEAE